MSSRSSEGQCHTAITPTATANHAHIRKGLRVSKRKKLNLPRVPLPRQTGGVHKVKTKVKHRDRKHKNNDSDDGA